MKKKLEILVYHLGYGGIEQMVSSISNLLKDEFEISILSFYKLYENPVFPIDPSISITYLYESNVPLKVKKYNQLLHQKKLGSLLREVFHDYLKGFHIITLYQDVSFSIGAYFLKGRYRRLKKHFKNHSSDIYLSTRYEISKILTKYGHKTSLKIGWEHNHYHGDQAYKKNLLTAYKNLDYLIVVSRALTNEYQEDLKNEKCNCIFIPNMLPYDLNFMSDCTTRNILFVGRLEKEKGLFDAIDVMKRLQQKMISFHFDIIGDGPLMKKLVKHVQEKGLSNYVQFHGFQNHSYIEKIYRQTALSIMTSYTESFGLVLLEAMNAGIPSLAFDSAEGARELILNNSNGFLIQNRNLDEMADKIVYLFQNPEEIKRLGKNAKEFSKNFFPNSVKTMWLEIMR